MKLCGGCSTEKEFSEFNRRGEGYQSRCRECQKILRADSYKRNREYERDRNRAWHQENKPWMREERREQFNAWRRANQHRRVVERHKRRGILKDAGTFPISEWYELCAKHNNKCLRCGKDEVTIDHVVPIARGGSNTIDNVQPLCQSCNSSKGTQIIDYRS